MSGHFKKNQGNLGSEEQRISSLKFTTSSYGLGVPVVFGCNKHNGNVFDYDDFKATAHESQQRSGKGGRSNESSSTTYTYNAAVTIGLCEGTISGIKGVWRDKKKTTLSKEGLSLFKGTNLQSPWSYMTSKHPEKAFNYPYLAYVAGYIALTDQASVPNYSFEVMGLHSGSITDTPVYGLIEAKEVFSFTGSGDNNLTSVVCSTAHGADFRDVISVYINYKKATNGQPLSSKVKTRQVKVSSYIAAPDGTITINIGNLSARTATVTIRYKYYGIAKTDQIVQLDANPADIIDTLLTNTRFGAGYPSGTFVNKIEFYNYCQASNFLFSPIYAEQRSVQEIIKEICEATNSKPVWVSGSKLKIVPFCDEVVSYGGYTYTPDLIPKYDLTEDDFLENSGKLVDIERSDTADAFNVVEIEFLNRSKEYAIDIVDARDLCNISKIGVRSAEVKKYHFICDREVGQRVANATLYRDLYKRATYSFKLGVAHEAIECMDIVTITDTHLSLDRKPVRITEIDRSTEGALTIRAEECLFGAAAPAAFEIKEPEGHVFDYEVAPDDTNEPIIFEPPAQITSTGLELWAAFSGGPNWGGAEVWVSNNNVDYKLQGEIKNPSRYGYITADFLAGESFDLVNTLKVDLSVSDGELTSASQEDFDVNLPLALVGEELISYKTVALTEQYKYDITEIKRGLHYTTIEESPIGSRFLRIGDAILKIPFTKSQIGSDVYIKFLSYNIYGSAVQALEDVEPYKYTLVGDIPPAVSNLSIEEDTYLLKDGTAITNLNVAFTEPDYTILSHYGISYMLNDDGNWITAGNTKAGNYTIKAIKNATGTIKVKVVTYNTFGIDSSEVVSGNLTLTGKSLPPPNVTSLTVTTVTTDRTKAKLTWPRVDSIPDLRGYEIRVGPEWDTGVPISTILYNTEEYTYTITENKEYKFHIKAVDNSYNYSELAYSTVYNGSVNPKQVSNFRAYQNGETILLGWDKITEPDVVGVEIRAGKSWNTGDLVVTGLKDNTFTIPVSYEKTYYYTIKAKTVAGNESVLSATASVVVANLLPKNVIQTYNELTLQSGVKTNTEFGISEYTWDTIEGTWDSYPTTSWDQLGSLNVLRLIPTSSGIDVSTQANAISGGDYSSNPASQAFDETTAYWGSSQGGAAVNGVAFIGQKNLVNPIRFLTYTNYSSAVYNITSVKSQYSNNDGVTWNDIATHAVVNTVSAVNSLYLPWYPGKNGHRLRLLANSTLTGSYRWIVREMQMYEGIYTQSGNYTTTEKDMGKDISAQISIDYFTNTSLDLSDFKAELQYRIRLSSGTFKDSEDGWETYIRPINKTFRYFQARCVLSTSDTSKTPQVSIFETKIDVPDVIMNGKATIPVGGANVSYGVTYFEPTSVAVAPQAVGGGKYAELISISAGVFNVIVRDSATRADVGGDIVFTSKGH